MWFPAPRGGRYSASFDAVSFLCRGFDGTRMLILNRTPGAGVAADRLRVGRDTVGKRRTSDAGS